MKNLIFIIIIFAVLIFSMNAISYELDSSECKSKPIGKVITHRLN